MSDSFRAFFCFGTLPLDFFSTAVLSAPARKVRPPQPVAKYCRTILIAVEVTQYRARPLGNDMQMKANISGIIHCIIWLWAFCWGSVVGGVIIFC